MQKMYINIYISPFVYRARTAMGFGKSTRPDLLSCQLDAQKAALKNRRFFFFFNINQCFKSQITAPGSMIIMIALK